jgi:hypothetical protein
MGFLRSDCRNAISASLFFDVAYYSIVKYKPNKPGNDVHSCFLEKSVFPRDDYIDEAGKSQPAQIGKRD